MALVDQRAQQTEQIALQEWFATGDQHSSETDAAHLRANRSRRLLGAAAECILRIAVAAPSVTAGQTHDGTRLTTQT